MATILEGLNAISQAVGGAGGAESNLEALNQISGALGGSADATENAVAIANIAENASGGGGSSEATVTLNFTDETGRVIEGYGSYAVFSTPAGSPPLDMFTGNLEYMSQSNIVKCFLGASRYEFGALFEGVEGLQQPSYDSITCTGGVSYDTTTHTFSVTGDGAITGVFRV